MDTAVKNCKFSIIIPVYKVEKYLSACLDSVLSQKLYDTEIILVDDGSPDACGDICDEYGEKFPETVRVIHQKNAGLGGARNTGINNAAGEYLVFLDSDDTLSPDALDSFRREIDKSGADIVLLPINTVDESGNVLRTVGFDTPQGAFSPKDYKKGLTLSPEAPRRVIRRELFEKTGVRFPPRVWYEDLRTTPKLYTAATKISCLEKPVYNYLQRSGSIMSSDNCDRTMEICDAMDDLYAWFGENGLADEYSEELRFMTADHLQFASVRLVKAGADFAYLKKIRAFVNEKCGGISKNGYYAALPRNRKIGLWLLRRGLFSVMKAVFGR